MKPAEDGGIPAGTVLFGKYQVESVLGRGGMGIVYCARHLALDERVAIKVLRTDVAVDEETVTRFVREAQSAVKLKSEHVARITDVGTFDDGLPYMVMEFLEGADLGQMIDGNGAMPVPYAVDLLLQACDAIAEAHSLGIVHRDIKPTNLFVSRRPDQTTIVKVLDFGISKSSSGADLSLTQTSSMLGTPAYMSPEQMRSARTVDARSDIWSLGTVLYELVEGRRPFLAESFSEMCVMVAVDPPLPMERGHALEPLLLKCLAKRPGDRYANVAELTRELVQFAASTEAARHYSLRAHRVLGLNVSGPIDAPPGSGQSLAGSAAASASPSMMMSAIENAGGPARRGPRRVWIGLLVVAISAVATIAVVKTTSTTSAVVDNAPVDRAGSSERTATKAGSAAAGSSATDTAGDASAATGSAVAELGSSGSASRSGSATVRSASVAVVKPPKKNRPRPRPPKPPHAGDGGAGSAAKGSGAGSAKPACDPFGSRRGC